MRGYQSIIVIIQSLSVSVCPEHTNLPRLNMSTTNGSVLKNVFLKSNYLCNYSALYQDANLTYQKMMIIYSRNQEVTGISTDCYQSVVSNIWPAGRIRTSKGSSRAHWKALQRLTNTGTIHVFAGDSVARSGFERVPSLLSNSSFRVEAQSQRSELQLCGKAEPSHAIDL